MASQLGVTAWMGTMCIRTTFTNYFVVTSLVYRINDTIRYVSSIHWYDTRYVSRYVSYHLSNKNIAETVIKLKSHMFHANIEAGIELVCNIGNMNFQKFPMAFWAGQFVDEHFIETYYASHQSQKLWLSLTVIRVMCMYNVHQHHNATRKWRASVSNLRLKNTHN